MEEIEYHIKSMEELTASCLPFVKNGGIFIKSNLSYHMNDLILVKLKMLDEEKVLQFTGKIIWITPKHEQNQLPEGIGVQFSEDEAEKIRYEISNILPDAFTMLNKKETNW